MHSKKPFFVEPVSEKKVGKPVHNPRTAGRLVDIYQAWTANQSVIDIYMENHSSLTDDEEEDLHYKKRESLNLLAESQQLLTRLRLPRWKLLSPELKHSYKTAACGLEPDGLALSCNLGSDIIGRVLVNPQGEALYLGRKVRAILSKYGLPLHFAMTLEFAPARESNPEMHFHGSFSVPCGLKATILEELKHALAHDYLETRNQAVHVEIIRTAGGWEAYTLKNLNDTYACIERPIYATHQASRLGKDLYQKICRWLRKDVKRLARNALKEIMPSPRAKASPALLEAIRKVQALRKEQRGQRYRRTRERTKQAALNPELYREQTFDAIRTTLEKCRLQIQESTRNDALIRKYYAERLLLPKDSN